jgi:chromosome segregation ATPase
MLKTLESLGKFTDSDKTAAAIIMAYFDEMKPCEHSEECTCRRILAVGGAMDGNPGSLLLQLSTELSLFNIRAQVLRERFAKTEKSIEDLKKFAQEVNGRDDLKKELPKATKDMSVFREKYAKATKRIEEVKEKISDKATYMEECKKDVVVLVSDMNKRGAGDLRIAGEIRERAEEAETLLGGLVQAGLHKR